MRMPRIKAKRGNPGLYHCMSRIVGGEFLLGDFEKENFVRQMWHLADFCGVSILNFTVMSNHYHQFVEVPGKVSLDDEELIWRVKRYYGSGSQKYSKLCRALQRGGGTAQRHRRLYLRMMGDISTFQKLLKQRFSTWYNHEHKRKGTLWMERFKSVFVDNCPFWRRSVSAYIDLNPVRAGIVDDPKDYRFCGYGAALGGVGRCREGLMALLGMDDWKTTATAYRSFLMGRGSKAVRGKRGFIDRDLLLQTLSDEGKLSMAEMVHLRVRYFSDGLVLGSRAFVEEIFNQYRPHFGKKRKSGARGIKGLSGQDLYVIRDLRCALFS